MFRLKKKVLKPMLRTLGKEKIGDLPRRTREAHEDLCTKQAETLLNPTSRRMEEEATAYAKWLNLSELEEGYLKHRVKLHWLNVGDRNNAFFHRTTQIRKMKNAIREVVNPDGEVLTK